MLIQSFFNVAAFANVNQISFFVMNVTPVRDGKLEMISVNFGIFPFQFRFYIISNDSFSTSFQEAF
jgi:hypothetical protein